MGLDVTHSFELQQLFFLNANAEAGISFDQNFVKTQGVDPDIFHQARIRGDDCRIGTGDAMQDFDKATLQQLLMGASLGQRPNPSNPAKVPALKRLAFPAVPAEVLVDRLMVNVDEEGEAILWQARDVGGHQDLSDLIEVPRQR